MRRTSGWTRLRNSFFALGLVAAAAGVARADSMDSALLAYDTTASTIGTTGVTFTGLTSNPNAISYQSVIGASFLAPSSLSLGSFQAAALGAGQSVTYNNTPFDIKFNVDGLNGQKGPFASTDTPMPLEITGVLNGTISGPNQANVTATFNPTNIVGATPGTPTYAFLTGIYANTLQITNNPLTIVPSTTNGGLTSVQGFLNSTPASLPSSAVTTPEPSTVLLFGATIVGFGFRQRLRKARAAA